jgi:hypothetical protein
VDRGVSDYQPRRPWCLPCRQADGSRVYAQFLGVACEWHWGILPTADQDALTSAVRRHHPNGGRVQRVITQIWVVRHDLRDGRNTVEKTWRDDAAELQADANA